jgi:hypothetical protein
MGEREWVKQIGKHLREDMGDCPTLPEEMVEILRKLHRLERQKPAVHKILSATEPVRGHRG